MKKFCLYRLMFPTGKSYIGITSVGIRRRMQVHKHNADRGCRDGAVYNAIRKYGLPEPEVMVIAPSWEYLTDLEQKAIKIFNTRAPKGYNLTDGGEGNLGGKMTENHYKAFAKRRGIPTGRPNRGWKHTPEAREKIRNAGTGRVFSEETKAKIGATKIGNEYNKGKIRSDETKLKLSESMKIAKSSTSDETRLKMSIAAKVRIAKGVNGIINMRKANANALT